MAASEIRQNRWSLSQGHARPFLPDPDFTRLKRLRSLVRWNRRALAGMLPTVKPKGSTVAGRM